MDLNLTADDVAECIMALIARNKLWAGKKVYGYFIASYACFFGFTTHSGAEGVGKNTKATVVAGMTSILIGGFVLSKLLLL